MILSRYKGLKTQSLLLSIIIVFIFINLSALHLAFYWDEAWSYAVAVFDMHTHGLAILPGQGNVELTRGHPLLFYFLGGVWINTFGTNLIAVHVYPLIISCLTLYVVYLLAYELSGFTTAIFTMVAVMIQPIFLAQSTMLLPEMMLTLWAILTLFCYLKKNWRGYVLFSFLLVMTKETGSVLIAALLVDRIFIKRFFHEKTDSGPQIFRDLAILSIPLLAFMAFISIQKIRLGWFLFPEHVNMMIWNPFEIWNRMINILKKLLTNQGRIILLAGSVIAIIIHLKRKTLKPDQKHFLVLMGLILILYVVFYAMNFFTTRYLLALIPLFIITGMWLITPLFNKKWLQWIFLLSVTVFFGIYSFTINPSEQDITPGFKNTVMIQQKAVHYAEDQKWQNKSIYSAFLMQYYMGIPDLGYLKDKSTPFYQIRNETDISYDLYIFCSNENDPNYRVIKNDPNVFLMQRFSKGIAWVEIYGRKMNPVMVCKKME